MMRSEFIQNGDVKLHALTAGSGPLVLMLHGFPGLAYSWRHQIPVLAEAGYKAVALDCRGYGQSDRPLAAKDYDAETYRSDILAVLDHFKAEQAIIIGQDFGAQHTWNFAVREPERTRTIITMVPYDMDMAGRFLSGNNPESPMVTLPPSVRFAEVAKDHFLHLNYFQTVGPAEKELGENPREFLRRILWALSAKGDLLSVMSHPTADNGYLDVLPDAPALPWNWMSETEFDHYLSEYQRETGDAMFVGGMNSYRTADINWEIGAQWAEANVEVPTLFLCGVDDPVLGFVPPDWQNAMKARVPGLRDIILIQDAGHFVQQEKPAETNAAILKFLQQL